MTKLLAPAGTLEKLYWVSAYGADEVYFGMKNFSLRSFAGNFTFEEAEEGLNHLHKLGKQGFVTLNIYPRSNEYEDLKKTALRLEEIGADAFIVADIGLISTLIETCPKVPIHVSTQANTVSSQTSLFYSKMGATRVNLARELSFDEIKQIAEDTKGKIETEVFIHGSVCFSYSGRCAISDYLAKRGANKGQCAQSCRWKYYLSEETRPNEYMPVFEDERGLYLFNSRDLALYRYVKKLQEAGVTSLKIEGRMKNIHYLASVVSIYRQLLDGKEIPDEKCLELLSRVSNRRYSEGFMRNGQVNENDYSTDLAKYISDAEFIAHGTGNIKDDLREFKVKGNMYAGETLEMLTPNGDITSLTLPSPILCGDGKYREVVHSSDTAMLDKNLHEFAMLRRLREKG